MKANPKCRVCGTKLTEENWNPSYQKNRKYICKKCSAETDRLWAKANPDKAKARSTRRNRKMGIRAFNENKECASFLGVHIAERVLSHAFKDVEVMPTNNPGYDFICNKGKKIDVKSACRRKTGSWDFHIGRNPTADYFLCLAFDNRENLNPLHVWLLPGGAINHLTCVGISQSTIHKWDEYKLDVSKITTCCEAMR